MSKNPHIKKKLDELHFSFNEDAWSDMEALLDAKEAGPNSVEDTEAKSGEAKDKRPFTLLLLLLLIPLGIGLAYSVRSSKDKTPTFNNSVLPESPQKDVPLLDPKKNIAINKNVDSTFVNTSEITQKPKQSSSLEKLITKRKESANLPVQTKKIDLQTSSLSPYNQESIYQNQELPLTALESTAPINQLAQPVETVPNIEVIKPHTLSLSSPNVAFAPNSKKGEIRSWKWGIQIAHQIDTYRSNELIVGGFTSYQLTPKWSLNSSLSYGLQLYSSSSHMVPELPNNYAENDVSSNNNTNTNSTTPSFILTDNQNYYRIGLTPSKQSLYLTLGTSYKIGPRLKTQLDFIAERQTIQSNQSTFVADLGRFESEDNQAKFQTFLRFGVQLGMEFQWNQRLSLFGSGGIVPWQTSYLGNNPYGISYDDFLSKDQSLRIQLGAKFRINSVFKKK